MCLLQLISKLRAALEIDYFHFLLNHSDARTHLRKRSNMLNCKMNQRNNPVIGAESFLLSVRISIFHSLKIDNTPNIPENLLNMEKLWMIVASYQNSSTLYFKYMYNLWKSSYLWRQWGSSLPISTESVPLFSVYIVDQRGLQHVDCIWYLWAKKL